MTTTVHLEVTQAVGRVYYHGNFEGRDPFHAVFNVLFTGAGTAKLIAAHGTIDMRAARLIAQELRVKFGVTKLQMERHGRDIEVDADRVSNFIDL